MLILSEACFVRVTQSSKLIPKQKFHMYLCMQDIQHPKENLIPYGILLPIQPFYTSYSFYLVEVPRQVFQRRLFSQVGKYRLVGMQIRGSFATTGGKPSTTCRVSSEATVKITRQMALNKAKKKLLLGTFYFNVFIQTHKQNQYMKSIMKYQNLKLWSF